MMAGIAGIEGARQLLGDFTFSEYRKILDLRFYRDAQEKGTAYRLDLLLESEDRNPNYRLLLGFSGVSALTIKDFGGGETRVIGFDIVDISANQWEGICWDVIDYENDAIHFYARTAEILSLTPVME